jgi:hypothetical protein
MSKRKLGDDPSQDLMPFVERIDIRSRVRPERGISDPSPPSPDPEEAVQAAPAPEPNVAAKPEPDGITVNAQPSELPQYEWGITYKEMSFWYRSNDRRPFAEKLAEQGLHHVFLRLLLWLVSAVLALAAPSSTASLKQSSGWVTTIERAR